jgi:hypothetical protein
VFTAAPRFSGGDQASWTLARVDTQMSANPRLPGRFDQNRISRPSPRTVVARVGAARQVQVNTAVTTGPAAVEEHHVPVIGQRRTAFFGGRIDDGPQVQRR